jgi:hypothetical protein
MSTDTPALVPAPVTVRSLPTPVPVGLRGRSSVGRPDRADGFIPDRPDAFTIDCDDCVHRHTTVCDDCIVSFIVDRHPGDAVVVDADEARAVRLLEQAGLVPGVRHSAQVG